VLPRLRKRDIVRLSELPVREGAGEEEECACEESGCRDRGAEVGAPREDGGGGVDEGMDEGADVGADERA